jgi:hypothetical protein
MSRFSEKDFLSFELLRSGVCASQSPSCWILRANLERGAAVRNGLPALIEETAVA